ncbi:hypothetical protein [Chryseobacterium sp. POE27]|uniref:hypothetical protein n=1 Tax=Chryseobacterium sp. POE27 TaxID=3138177 RepID=UPI00321BAE51
MKTTETTSPLEIFEKLTKIGASISYKFDGIFEKDHRKTKSTYYLAKVLNTNMTILSLINGTENYSDSIDLSTIYSLLRNQLETCNIYWHLIDDYSTDLNLLIFEYHDTLSSQVIYNSLFYTEENEKYFKEKEEKQLIEIENNLDFQLLDNNRKKQIINGNRSTIYTQFEIIDKRGIDLRMFKAYYKIFSTHIHSSPTAIKNLVSSKINKDNEEFEIMFLFVSLNYISLFIADMILSVIDLWKINDLKENDKRLLEFLKTQLYSDSANS